MIILGLVLLIVGWLLGISILETIGIVLVAAGVLLMLIGYAGNPVGGRSHWW